VALGEGSSAREQLQLTQFADMMGRLLDASMGGASGEVQRQELSALVGSLRQSLQNGSASGGGGVGGGGGCVGGGVGCGMGCGMGCGVHGVGVGGLSLASSAEDVAWSKYDVASSSINGQLRNGQSVSSGLYLERDEWLHQLSDEQLQREYVVQSEAYLEPSTPHQVRGMAEMLLIKLGELMGKPAHVRRSLWEQQKVAAARVQASEVRTSAADAADAAGARRDAEWNRAAYTSVRAALLRSLEAPEVEEAAFKRLANRAELQLVLATQKEASKLTHAQQQAWGTGGLTPIECRAVLHAISHVIVLNGQPAMHFRERLKARVRELPPPSEADDAYPAPARNADGRGDGVLRL